MPQETILTRPQAIDIVAAELTGPIAFDEFADRVQALAQSAAKNPKTGIRNILRFERIEHGLAYLDDTKKTLTPIAIGLPGVRFRLAMSEIGSNEGVLFFNQGLSAFLPRRFRFAPEAYEAIQLVDKSGHSLPTKIKTVSREVDSPFGAHEVRSDGFDLLDWFQAHNIQADDSVLVSFDDWTIPRCRLIHEPATARDDAAIHARDAELADVFYAMLEAERSESLSDRWAVIEAHLRLSDPQGYPGSPWQDVIAADERMDSWGFDIRYADRDQNIFDQIFMGADSDAVSAAPELTVAEANQVYRFKCALKHRKGLWRRIEIRGGQTLAEFNRILVNTFGHEWDHMGGFWKRVRRGNSKRFREIDLGSIDPFGDGDGADTTIAEIDLAPGDAMKYVFDFGDWHEHVLTLEEIMPAAQADTDAEYPRVVEQNRPRYRYCCHCKEVGLKTIATWACLECSNDERQAVFVCEECLVKHHEEHYIDKVVY